MSRVSTKMSAFFIVLYVVTTGVSSSQSIKSENWELFSEGIKMALKSPNPGVQQSAILLIIRYGEKLDIEDAVSDMISYYHNAEDDLAKKLAVLAVFRIDRSSAYDLLAVQLDSQIRDAQMEISKLYER